MKKNSTLLVSIKVVCLSIKYMAKMAIFRWFCFGEKFRLAPYSEKYIVKTTKRNLSLHDQGVP